MIRIVKHIALYATIIVCAIAITNTMIGQFQKKTPQKAYVIPEIEYKKQARKRTKLYEHLKPKPIDHKQQFYNTIIEKNIFAPLGYKPKKKEPTYRLIGTHIPTKKTYQARAILQETMDKKSTHIVNIGTKLTEDTIVMDIQPKQVILKKGKHRILIRMNTTQFLK